MFGELRQPLLRYLVCLGLPSEEGREVVQETFLRLHQHVARGGSRENLRSWVFRVAHNRALNCQKRSGRSAGEPVPDVETPVAGPEQLLLEKERLARLRAAIRGLPRVQQECLHLRAEGLRYREIADVLEIGVTTVADHLDRAIRKLAKELP
jgi:RNA polymerase sigma-70 factor (ECF subfamily)